MYGAYLLSMQHIALMEWDNIFLKKIQKKKIRLKSAKELIIGEGFNRSYLVLLVIGKAVIIKTLYMECFNSTNYSCYFSIEPSLNDSFGLHLRLPR